ncbi:MAG TPA: beta-ketoacyl synthase N-terminal-like domain-containing protein, partial [Polyangiaceae bacterium]|nr:beta-ketoacyl synthase N-terminal-like domain-containing protein [Polyangiaceae bacterium]
LSPSDLDLTLVSSFVGDRFGVGNAAYLAKELRLRAPAWNFETACSSSVVGLHMAASLLRSGDYRRILVVTSTSNSVQVEEDDTIGWFVGDGAGAFVVEPVERGFGVLGWKTINSVETNDMFVIHSVPETAGSTRLCTSANENASGMARDTAEPYLRTCVDGALAMASMTVREVDFWVFNTPNAWYADFCARVLGVDSSGPARYHSVYSRYSNIGAALMPATLYHALDEKRVGPGAVVGLYSVGSTSTASALIMKIGDVALGPRPE